ncbi:hypothetical protein Q5752_006469 [Cryptotrichosporon argae]
MTRLAYVGLGNMGSQMCANLCAYAKRSNLPPVLVWNRSSDKYATVPRAEPAENLTALAGAADIVFTCLLNDAAAEDVYGEMLAAVEQGKDMIFIDQSSLTPKMASKLQDAAAAKGATYLSSPVFGPPAVAKTAQLLLVLGGAPAAKERVKPILVPAIGKAIIDVGEQAAKGVTLKLLGNTCILGTIELLAETYALADSVDFDPHVFQDFIGQWFPAPSSCLHLPSNGCFAFNARNILSLGADLGHPCPVPTIERALGNMERAKTIGGPDMDWSSLAIAAREQAGLEPFREGATGGQPQGQ